MRGIFVYVMEFMLTSAKMQNNYSQTSIIRSARDRRNPFE